MARIFRGQRGVSSSFVLPLTAVVVGLLYVLLIFFTSPPVNWKSDLPGYYNLLGRAFRSGTTALPVAPAPELLALQNPYDPAANGPYRLHDAVLFQGRYYLYHGPAPAVVLFAPWRLLTRHDLPENVALVFFCLGGFLFSAGTLLEVLRAAEARPRPWALGLLLLCLGICQGAPLLLSRVWVYEVAIGGGYFFVSGGLFFLTRAFRSSQAILLLAAAGLFFGGAVACRPHLGTAGVLAAAVVVFWRPRALPAFLLPFTAVGALLLAYNYARFGSPFEFGLRYLLALDATHTQMTPQLSNVGMGVYYLLFTLPDFSLVFPWVRAMFRLPWSSTTFLFPPGSYIEPIAGALAITPLLAGVVFLALRHRRAIQETALAIALLAAAGIIIFVAATGFSTQRYEIDFLPLLLLAALSGTALLLHRRHRAGMLFLVPLAAYSLLAHLALGFSGPYEDVLRDSPKRYLFVASKFSPSRSVRTIRNPRIDVELQATFAKQIPGFREPLLFIGHQTGRYMLYAEHTTDAGNPAIRLIGLAPTGAVTKVIPHPGNSPVSFRFVYSPQNEQVTVESNGQTLLQHATGVLVTAPAQVRPGENRIDHRACVPKFTGKLTVLHRTVEPAS